MSNYSRLSQTYFAYFAILGVTAHYFGLYLTELGLTPVVVGGLLSVMTAGRIIGPLLWSSLADRLGQRRGIIQLGAILAFVCFAVLCLVDVSEQAQGIFALAILSITIAGFSLFWTAILPQLEVVTAQKIKGNAKIYSRIRLWGSLSFTLCVFLSGVLFEKLGVIKTVEWLTLGLLLLLAVSCYRLPLECAKRSVSAQTTSLMASLRQKNCLLFMLSAFLLQLGFAAYYGFFSVYLSELGYSGYQIGALLAFAVTCEIVVFIYAGAFVRRFSIKALLSFCLLLTALRWFMLAEWASLFWLLLISQTIHAFSFALHHVAAQKFIRQHFTIEQQGRGQAIYLAASFGTGGSLGSLITGYSWQWGGDISFYIAAGVTLLATGLALGMKP